MWPIIVGGVGLGALAVRSGAPQQARLSHNTKNHVTDTTTNSTNTTDSSTNYN